MGCQVLGRRSGRYVGLLVIGPLNAISMPVGMEEGAIREVRQHL